MGVAAAPSGTGMEAPSSSGYLLQIGGILRTTAWLYTLPDSSHVTVTHLRNRALSLVAAVYLDDE